MTARKPKFVQIAVATTPESEDSGSQLHLYALDSSGAVWNRFEHTRYGWGWYPVRGDDNRRRIIR